MLSFFQETYAFLQRIMHSAAGSHFGTFLAPGGVNGRAEPSRAEPGRAEPSRVQDGPKGLQNASPTILFYRNMFLYGSKRSINRTLPDS